MLQCKTLKHKHYSGWFLHWASATLRAEPPLSLSPPPHLGTQTQPHNLPFCAAPVLVCQINVQQIIQRHSTEAAKGAAVWLEEGVTFRTPSLQLWLRSWFLLLSDLVGKNCRSSVTPLLQIMKGKKKKKVCSGFWKHACPVQDLHFIFICPYIDGQNLLSEDTQCFVKHTNLHQLNLFFLVSTTTNHLSLLLIIHWYVQG